MMVLDCLKLRDYLIPKVRLGVSCYYMASVGTLLGQRYQRQCPKRGCQGRFMCNEVGVKFCYNVKCLR